MHFRIRMSRLAAVLCSLSVVPATVGSALAQEQGPPPASAPPPSAPPAAPPKEPAPEIPKDQLDSLVAPIALYPDPLLAQVLAASTYPLEIVQLQQWLEKHKDLKDQALIDAVEKENWDPSVQSMAALPDVVKLLATDIKWTTDLGNAFLAQQAGVMEAVQRMRVKAQKNGTLKSNDKTKVETKTVEKETIVVIEQANPEVVYVPSYNPTVVYGAPVYPYPVVAYPPPPPPGAYVATAAISFGVGVMVGAAFHGGWGYNCGWGGGHSNVYINNNNNFVKTSNVRAGGQAGAGRGQWQHNPQHRGGAPYGNQATANKFGGTSRDTSRGDRQEGRGDGRQGGDDRGDRRQGGGDDRGAKRQPAGEGRAGGGAEQRADRGGGGAESRSADRGATDSNRVGNRSDSPGAGGGASRGGDALGGGSRGSYSGSDARSSSARGSSSAGGRSGGSRGGGGGRGGGGRGGGRR